MKNINWGITGTGRIARTFSDALAKTQNAVLYAVASRSKNKAENFAQEYGFSKAYGSYSELAQDNNIDIVYIATPMASHFNDVMLCLENGKNVLCEKSVTLNSEQLEKILSKAKEKKLFFMEAMWTKCRPVFLKTMEWVKNNRIGDIKYIKADFSNNVKYNPDDRLFRADCGGGALLDLAVYPLSFAEAFLGYPDEIISFAHIRDGIDLSNSITLKYNNAFVSIDSGFEISLKNNAIISGTDGYIILGDWFFCTCDAVLYDRNGSEIEKFNAQNIINGYEYEIIEAQRCICENLKESPLIPHSGTISVMKIMDECRRQWGLKFPDEQ
ncbi:MAG TPA: gfo/Idh/MocA family oxidoreductase [Ruminococcus sp.]|nr:gfo/Idh/MocA family oxidoreductase [Ruminococcus sp.]